MDTLAPLHHARNNIVRLLKYALMSLHRDILAAYTVGAVDYRKVASFFAKPHVICVLDIFTINDVSDNGMRYRGCA